jgi:putative iron-dependent peroxidase
VNTPQPGIFAQGTRSHRHLEFDLRPDASPDDVLVALQALRQPSVTAGGANIVIGFGPDLWRRIAPGETPRALGPYPDLVGLPRTQHDLWIWTHGAGDDVLLDVTLAAAACVQSVADLVADVTGFVYHDGRDITGFLDGTENPSVEDAFEVAVVANGPGAGGSFAITQRWVHDLESFHAMSVAEQEGVIGRTKPDSIELDDGVKPPTAHISRVVIEEDGEELEIYRRSVPYGSVAEHGLYFVAFSADPTRFEKMLRRMFGQSGDGLHDRLTDFVHPVSGSAYFVPSLGEIGDALG